MRSSLLVVALAAACGPHAPVAEPTEPRELDTTVEEQIRDAAAKIPEDCEPGEVEVYLEAGTVEDATYVATACTYTYRFHATCERPTTNGDRSAFWRCSIDLGEEIPEADAAEALVEAKENDLDDVTDAQQGDD